MAPVMPVVAKKPASRPCRPHASPKAGSRVSKPVPKESSAKDQFKKRQAQAKRKAKVAARIAENKEKIRKMVHAKAMRETEELIPKVRKTLLLPRPEVWTWKDLGVDQLHNNAHDLVKSICSANAKNSVKPNYGILDPEIPVSIQRDFLNNTYQDMRKYAFLAHPEQNTNSTRSITALGLDPYTSLENRYLDYRFRFLHVMLEKCNGAVLTNLEAALLRGGIERNHQTTCYMQDMYGNELARTSAEDWPRKLTKGQRKKFLAFEIKVHHAWITKQYKVSKEDEEKLRVGLKIMFPTIFREDDDHVRKGWEPLHFRASSLDGAVARAAQPWDNESVESVIDEFAFRIKGDSPEQPEGSKTVAIAGTIDGEINEIEDEVGDEFIDFHRGDLVLRMSRMSLKHQTISVAMQKMGEVAMQLTDRRSIYDDENADPTAQRKVYVPEFTNGSGFLMQLPTHTKTDDITRTIRTHGLI